MLNIVMFYVILSEFSAFHIPTAFLPLRKILVELVRRTPSSWSLQKGAERQRIAQE